MIFPLFRPTTADFRLWCRDYVGLAFHIAAIHEQNPLILAPETYKAAQKICRQYNVLLASLNDYERKLFKNRIMKSKAIRFSAKEERNAFCHILENWQEICFPGGKYQLKTITKEQIGEKIKTLRIRNGYTRKKVADIIGISEATIRAYENGDRMLRLDVAYQLAQIYGETLNSLIEE